MKTCTVCKIPKSRDLFCVDSSRKDGLHSSCKECKSVLDAKYRKNNQDRIKANRTKYYELNKDKICAKTKKWYKDNIELAKKHNKEYCEKNKGEIKLRKSESYIKNKEKYTLLSATRYIKNKEKYNAYSKTYHKLNPERVAIAKAKYAFKNKEAQKEKCAIYYLNNKEKCKAAVIKWESKNKSKRKIYVQNRRARAAGGRLSIGLADRLFVLQRGLCPCCKMPLGDNYHMDHIMPLALGGTNTDDNIQLLRSTCNQQKNAKDPIKFMQSRGFLL